MDMHHVRYFLALSEDQNFTRAARRCHVSQPSLTNAIKVLEKEMGGALFTRLPTVMLTELGIALEPYFRGILLNADLSLSETHTRIYWWCSPPKIGTANV